MNQRNWKYIILFLLAIPVVNYVAGYLGKSMAQYVNKQEEAKPQQPNANQEIRVLVSSQDSEGITQQNFDLNFLKNLEAYTVERVKVKTKEYLVSQGHPNAVVNFTSEATYVESGHMKLAVIRLRASEGSEGSNQVLIFGIIGNELKKIACIRNSTETIPISYGVCADKIKEVFGVKIGG